MSIFSWFTGGNKTPAVEELIAAAGQRTEQLKADMAKVVVEAAEGAPGAQEKYRQAKADLAQVEADLAMLQQAKVEAAKAEQARQAEQRREAQRAKLVKVKASLAESNRAAQDFQKHAEAMSAAFDRLVAARVEARSDWPMPLVWSYTHLGQIRGVVGAELFRVGARLNSLAQNSGGIPTPGVDLEMHMHKANPAALPPITERLAAIDQRIIAHLEGQIK